MKISGGQCLIKFVVYFSCWGSLLPTVKAVTAVMTPGAPADPRCSFGGFSVAASGLLVHRTSTFAVNVYKVGDLFSYNFASSAKVFLLTGPNVTSSFSTTAAPAGYYSSTCTTIGIVTKLAVISFGVTGPDITTLDGATTSCSWIISFNDFPKMGVVSTMALMSDASTPGSAIVGGTNAFKGIQGDAVYSEETVLSTTVEKYNISYSKGFLQAGGCPSPS